MDSATQWKKIKLMLKVSINVLDSCWIDFCLSSHEKNQNNFIGIFFQYIKPSSPIDRKNVTATFNSSLNLFVG